MRHSGEDVRVRLALAQLNVVVGDLDGNVEKIVGAVREAERAGADARRPARARGHRLPAGGSPPAAGVRARCARGRRRGRARVHADSRAHRRPCVRPRSRQCRVRLRGRRGARRVPQAVPPELRGLRRAPLLRARPRAPAAPARRRPRRADDLRGRLAARPAGDRPRARGRDSPRQPLRLAVPRRQGGGPRGDARHASARQRRVRRVLQPRRRAGRARLRRPLGRPRRRGRGDRPGSRASRRRCSSSTSTPTRRSAGGSATCAAASWSVRARSPWSRPRSCSRAAQPSRRRSSRP